MKLVKTIAANGVGFWCAALDAAGNRLFVGGTDGNIHVYDLLAVALAKIGPLKGHGSYVTSLVFVPASRQLISGSFDKHLIWWKPADGVEPLRKVDGSARINRLVANPDGSRLAAACADCVGRAWDVATGKLVAELRDGHPRTTKIGRLNTLYSVAFSPDGKTLATGDRAGTITLWESATGKKVRQISAAGFYSQAMQQDKQASEYEWGGVKCLVFAPDGKTLMAGGMGPADQNSAGIDGPMRLEVFDVASGKSIVAFSNNAHKGMLTTLVFHPTSGQVIAGGGGGKAGDSGVGSLWVWDPKLRDKDGKPVPPTMQASEVVAREVLVGPDGKTLLVAGMLKDVTAGRIEMWDLIETPKPEPPVKK